MAYPASSEKSSLPAMVGDLLRLLFSKESAQRIDGAAGLSATSLAAAQHSLEGASGHATRHAFEVGHEFRLGGCAGNKNGMPPFPLLMPAT